jgi:MarR family transcriptional regulator, 2-MHQ and catechol-resistance regulon repressor
MPTRYQGTPRENLALDTFIKLNRCANALTSRLTHRGTLGSLTQSQFGVLEALYHLGPLCPGEISTKVLKSTGNITMVIDNLEKYGLVKRSPHPQDRRSLIVSLTAKGEELISQVLPLHVKAIRDELSVLTLEEQETLGQLCRKLGMGKNAQEELPLDEE